MVDVALASGAHEWFRYSHIFGVMDCLELLFDLMMENVGVDELWHSAISVALACVVFSVRSWIACEGWLSGGRRRVSQKWLWFDQRRGLTPKQTRTNTHLHVSGLMHWSEVPP